MEHQAAPVQATGSCSHFFVGLSVAAGGARLAVLVSLLIVELLPKSGRVQTGP